VSWGLFVVDQCRRNRKGRADGSRVAIADTLKGRWAMSEIVRRPFLRTLAVGVAGAAAACGHTRGGEAKENDTKESDKDAEEVSATRILMREHGVLKRVLLVEI
jgi:hypothetical protein